MIGFVLVSHSRKLAEGAKELALMMAPEVPVEAAGGLPDGSLGTDFEAIRDAIEKVSLPGVDTVEHGARLTEETIRLFKARGASPICTISPALLPLRTSRPSELVPAGTNTAKAS